jgi:hypothetical protein
MTMAGLTLNIALAKARRYCQAFCPAAGTVPSAEKCANKNCPLHDVRLDNQLKLFDKVYRKWWFDTGDALVDEMPHTFWMGAFRGAFYAGPENKNWWGPLTRRWTRRGYRQTGNQRPSIIESLNGHAEKEYTRGLTWQAYKGPGIAHLAEMRAKKAA